MALAAIVWVVQGCTYLHHIQIGDIDNRPGYKLKPFDIKFSETGVSLDDIKAIAGALGAKDAAQGAEWMKYFQFGPKTGNPVYVENYAEDVIRRLHKQCKSGRITGLRSLRESRKYPVISGEIIKVTGYCMVKR